MTPKIYLIVLKKVFPFADNYLRKSVAGYATLTNKDESIQIQEKNSMYVLFPIWIVSYDYEDQKHTLVMNGQTGKIVGKTPLSIGKVALWLGGISAASFTIIKIFSGISGGVWW